RPISSHPWTCLRSCATTTSNWWRACAKRMTFAMSMATSPRRASSKTGSTKQSDVPGFCSKRRVRARASEPKRSSILDAAGFRSANYSSLASSVIGALSTFDTLFRVSREFLELCFVYIRHIRAQRQRGAADAKSLAFRFEAVLLGLRVVLVYCDPDVVHPHGQYEPDRSWPQTIGKVRAFQLA